VSRGPAPILAASTLLLTACLLPQDDNLLIDLPPPLNRPPRIVESAVQPASRILTVDGGAGCPQLVFSAPAEDPDTADILFYDFYVDASSTVVAQGTLSPSGSVQRTEEAAYAVSFATAGPVQAPGTHLVEVLVADGPLVNRVPLPRTVLLPDGGTRVDPTFAASYAWQVTVEGTPCP
jgi:hypothetical protein